MKMPYHILEVANCHGGNYKYVMSLIDEFKNVKFGQGIKFQPFKYSSLALDDYSWYKTYKKLYFNPNQWHEIIKNSYKYKNVWLDIFDNYSLKILNDNKKYIYGIKIQSSVLFNERLLLKLAKLNFNKLYLIINISGISKNEIKNFTNKFQQIDQNKIILQFGYQDYPTHPNHSGLHKINILKKTYSHKLSYADHINPKEVNAYKYPLQAIAKGVEIIEKHIMHSHLKTNYDYYSSSNCEEILEYEKNLKRNLKNNKKIFVKIENNKFIINKEKKYLENSILTPIIRKQIVLKRPVSLKDDFIFRRTSQKGLTSIDIKKLQNKFYILNRKVKKHETLKKEYFSKSKIATLIACRMKSSRLKNKAILKIGKLSSIELCIKNALSFKNVDYTILATSNLKPDAVLKNFTFDKKVIFHRGDPEDVVKRYLKIIKKIKIDTIIRVTGDMPFISNDILQILLKNHFQSSADFTTTKKAAIGTNLEIINTSSLMKLNELMPNTRYSEYMSFYFKNNPNIFKINYVDLPQNLISKDRLTLDYEEDLIMFNKLDRNFNFYKNNIRLEEILSFLKKNKQISKINNSIIPKYLNDQKLIDKLNKVTKIKN